MLGQVGDDLLAVPGVVAERQHVGAGGEQRLGHLWAEAEAVRGVLGVHHHQIEAKGGPQAGKGGGDGLPAGAAEDVAEEEDAHGGKIAECGARGSGPGSDMGSDRDEWCAEGRERAGTCQAGGAARAAVMRARQPKREGFPAKPSTRRSRCLRSPLHGPDARGRAREPLNAKVP